MHAAARAKAVEAGDLSPSANPATSTARYPESGAQELEQLNSDEQEPERIAHDRKVQFLVFGGGGS